MTPSLRSNNLVSALEMRARKSTQAATLYGVLQPIVDDVTPLLEFIRQSFPGYPKHGIDHSLRILQRIGGILTVAAIRSLSNYELFCLILAAVFHDAGMVAPESRTPNDDLIRSNHHHRSAELFLRYFPDRLALLSNERMAKVVAFTIESHGLSWEEMSARSEFSRYETLDGELIRPCILAILLRVGDLLDLDSDRTSDLCLKYCAAWYSSKESSDHNDRHRHVKHFKYDSNTIEVDVECPNLGQHKIWFVWLEYLRTDIERANTYVFHGDLSLFRLPVPKLRLGRSEEAKFETWPLRFEIDESGTLWDVISRSIYTGRYDYVRELIQNSIDACLKRIYEDPLAKLTSPSPRKWTLKGYKPSVTIVVSTQGRRLCVSDNGIGMDRDSIKEFLFRVAGSGMKSSKASRAFKFPSIATFGIGFTSVLTRAARLKIVTKPSVTDEKDENKVATCVQLDVNLRDAIVETERESATGTAIVLTMKDIQYLRDLREYITNTFRYQCVDIHFIDWDEVLEVARILEANGFRANIEDLRLVNQSIWTSNCLGEQAHHYIEQFLGYAKKSIERPARSRPRKSTGSEETEVLLPPTAEVTLIKAQEPEKPKIVKSWQFTLDSESYIRRGHEIEGAASSQISPSASLIVVPVIFTDYEMGIEWRSLHSFLAARGSFSRQLSIWKSSSREVNPLVMSLEETAGITSIYEEFKYRIADEFQSTVDSDDEDFLEASVERTIARSLTWDDEHYDISGTVLILNRFGISRYLNIDFEEPVIDRWSEVEDFFDHPVDSGVEEKPELTRAVEWYRRKVDLLYQDGIVLPLKLSDVAPVGAVVGIANFLTRSRLSYNVSRNALDESLDKLRAWRSYAGKSILERVAVSVIAALDALGVAYRWRDLWTGDEKESRFSSRNEWVGLEDDARKLVSRR